MTNQTILPPAEIAEIESRNDLGYPMGYAGVKALLASHAALLAEVERLKQRILDDNKSYGCELRDPYGTVWEYATHLLSEVIRLKDLLQRIHGWDHMDSAADGPYWRSEIDAALGPAPATPGGGP